MTELDSEVRSNLYLWLDSVPFSRPRKRLARYFADASAVAELINYFSPNFVQQTAFPPCSKRASKIDNWERLNRKALSKLGLSLSTDQIRNLVDAKLEYTEAFLCELAAALYSKNYDKIQRVLEESGSRPRSAAPEDEDCYAAGDEFTNEYT